MIPAHAEVLVDCRVPPGTRTRSTSPPRCADAQSRDGGRGKQMEHPRIRGRVHRARVGNRSAPTGRRSPSDRGWWSAPTRARPCVPIAMPAFSDSTVFRRAFPRVVYGFWNSARDVHARGAGSLIHGADERVEAADIGLAATSSATSRGGTRCDEAPWHRKARLRGGAAAVIHRERRRGPTSGCGSGGWRSATGF